MLACRTCYWRSMFVRMAEAKLTPLQKLILMEAGRREGQGLTMTGLARAISAERGIPLSTVKWNMARLREFGLITVRKENRRRVCVLTTAGRILARHLSRGACRYHKQGRDKNRGS